MRTFTLRAVDVSRQLNGRLKPALGVRRDAVHTMVADKPRLDSELKHRPGVEVEVGVRRLAIPLQRLAGMVPC